MLPRLEELLSVLDDMITLEEGFSALYETCSRKFPEDEKFWIAIANQERLHANFIHELKHKVEENPGDFSAGRSFNVRAIKSIVDSINKTREEVSNGRVDRKRALGIAKDIENSLLEAKYHEIVSTKNLDFQKLIDRIVKDTDSHKKLFAAKFAREK